jgi:hypothetical protein
MIDQDKEEVYEAMFNFANNKEIPLAIRLDYSVFVMHVLILKLIKNEEALLDVAHKAKEYADASRSDIDSNKKKCESIYGTDKPKKRELNDREKVMGRSLGYWEMSAEAQWTEDKALGILDWDGK